MAHQNHPEGLLNYELLAHPRVSALVGLGSEDLDF